MGRLRDMLDRFRPAGTPGAAGRAGVPADRSREEAAELAGVFAVLEPVAAECREIRAAAERDADDVRRRAAEEADALVRTARARAEAERAAAAANTGSRRSAESTAVIAAAERRAARIRDRADERMTALVAQAVETVRRTGAAEAGHAAAGTLRDEAAGSGGAG